MSPKEIVQKWVDTFNNKDINGLADLYTENAINHQVNTDPLHGKESIKQMFTQEFAKAEMVCIVENIFEDGEWAILEWKDQLGLRGSGFFQTEGDQIKFQRGYWDRLTFLKMHNLSIPTN